MNLLITGAWSDAKRHLAAIEQMGHAVRFLQNERDPLPCDPAWVEGVVANGLFLHHPLSSFPHLRLIQLTSAGTDRVPVDEIAARGIELKTARGVYSAPMAEYAVGGVLWLYKQASFFEANRAAHRWEKRRDLRELCGKRVLIVGCGSVGTACAKRFSAFDAFVTGVDVAPRTDPFFAEMLPMDRLDEALETADVAVLALPLTEKTRGLFDAARFRRMKPDAILVNISRGAVVDTDALLSAPIGGAVLDVFADEPLPPDSPLWDRPNFLLTPHNSFVGDGNGERLKEVIFTQLKKTDKGSSK
ncbi:MAG: D-2-hydroxyacid dehydrogenase [Clostridia bacterium]|nr:D-2-hydroxyacid dehydrogenase [Clostridia bacterium]